MDPITTPFAHLKTSWEAQGSSNAFLGVFIIFAPEQLRVALLPLCIIAPRVVLRKLSLSLIFQSGTIPSEQISIKYRKTYICPMQGGYLQLQFP